MKSKWLALLLVSSCLALPVSAQMTEDTGTHPPAPVADPSAAGIDAMVAKVNILTRTKTLTELPENDPIALDLGLVDVPGVSKSLTEGVTAKAYARYVSVDDMLIGQLVLSSVGKGNSTEPLNSDNFAAQFNLDQTSLDPSSPITIEGDQPELVAALERLAAAQEEPEEAAKEDELADAGVGASDGKVGSNASSNPDASGYSTPGALDVGKEAVISSNITTEGCNIRVDLDQLQAIQQTRVVTTTDGTPEYGACADGAERFKISQSYAVCSYDENVEAMTATAQFIYYYTDGGGNREEIGDCQPDAEKIFDIVEDRNACNVYLDYTNLQAVPQGKLVYTNHNGKVIPVADCAASIEVDPVPMVQTTEGCDIRDDFIAGKSFGRSKYIYTLDGRDWDTSCQDNDEEYPHSTIYKTANGDQVCEPIINRESGKVTLQSRVMINVNGFELYRSPCTPDTTAKDIQSTTAGCEDPAKWTHNITASQSIGSERFYYLIDGKQEAVTECQDNDVIYAHQQETTGYQNHDDKLFSYRLVTLYIEGTPQGRYNIATSQVLAGDPQIPYAYEGQSPKANGEVFYEECTRFEGRDLVNAYTRPDGTTYNLKVDEDTPVNVGSACDPVIVWGTSSTSRFTQPMRASDRTNKCGTSTLSYYYRTDTGDNGPGSQLHQGTSTSPDHCAWTDQVATKTIIREDSVQIGDAVTNNCRATNRSPSIQNQGTPNSSWHVVYNSSVPGFPSHSNSVKSGCLGNWGWW
ncbi:hypothetical protein [Thalassospira sp.]|uniref:hypothetical protein n=1 Tax=Thalassospira sp. TaxID=1912094 RepID=UPI0027371194|nr:hypothetical protein [Thalassospira sp.]MDP2699928.1 hypothetical protein [Thalassospira sp.]